MSWTVYSLEETPQTVDILPNPYNEPVFEIVSTKEEVILADGRRATISPPVKSRAQPVEIEFSPLHDIPTIEDKIKSYIDSGKKYKIKTHTGEEITGWFTRCSKVYSLISGEQGYILRVTFMRE